MNKYQQTKYKEKGNNHYKIYRVVYFQPQIFLWMNFSNQKVRTSAKFKQCHIPEKAGTLLTFFFVPNPENEIIKNENDRVVSVKIDKNTEVEVVS